MAKNMTTGSSLSSYIKKWSNVIPATAYLDIADEVPHRSEGEAVLLEHVPINAKSVLDLRYR
jgi:tRNA (cmo5U34)-methyltransferase